MEREEIESVQRDESCPLCGVTPVFTMCAGCGRGLCSDCSRFELIGSGCGTVWPVYYCAICAADPMINPNAPIRE